MSNSRQNRIEKLEPSLGSADECKGVVLSGHDHSYERFAPLNPGAVIDPVRGIRSFVIGTGGGTLSPFGEIKSGSEARNSTTQGVLKLTLRASDFSWEFIPVPGGVFEDAGTAACH